MIVILMVLPLYNKGYARIGTEKETFFLKIYDLWCENFAAGIFTVAAFPVGYSSSEKGVAEVHGMGRRDYGRI